MALHIFRNLFQQLSQIVLSVFLPRLSPEILSSEMVSRYLLQSNDYILTKARVKPKAFLPNKELETSIFRIDKLKEPKIWEIGEIYVARPRNKTLHARADVSVAIIKACNLQVKRQEPPPRHANIINWPNDKDARMSLAQEIAAEATLQLPSDKSS